MIGRSRSGIGVGKATMSAHAGVVHEDVEPAELLAGNFECLPSDGAIGHVADNRFGTCDRVGLISSTTAASLSPRRATSTRSTPARANSMRNRPANASGRAGHESALVLESSACHERDYYGHVFDRLRSSTAECDTPLPFDVDVHVAVAVVMARHSRSRSRTAASSGANAAGVFLRQAAMDRHAVAGERAAEDLAVLGQIGQQPAVGDVGFDVDVEEMLRERFAHGGGQSRRALARLRADRDRMRIVAQQRVEHARLA